MFQVFAQLIELRPAPLPGLYLHMFPGLLSPTFWERPGNIPALVRLLQAYLAKGGEAVVQNGRLVVRRASCWDAGNAWNAWLLGAAAGGQHAAQLG